jgi:hypothetical protein
VKLIPDHIGRFPERRHDEVEALCEALDARHFCALWEYLTFNIPILVI